MPGNFGFPYRPPCGGWPAQQTWFLGGPFQHRRTGEAGIQAYANGTLVPDYHLPTSTEPLYAPGGILPYPRLDDQSDWPSGGTCPSPGTQPNPNCGQTTPGYAPCGPWFDGPSLDDRPAMAGMPPAVVDHNSYAAVAGQLNDYSNCRKIGFKNVQAVKAWHGRLSYLTHDNGGRPDRVAQGACACNIELEQGAPDDTKYRTETVTVNTHNTVHYGGSVVGENQASATLLATVDRLSGLVTGSGATTVATDTGSTGCTGASCASAILAQHLGLYASAPQAAWAAFVAAWGTGYGTVTQSETSGTYSFSVLDATNTSMVAQAVYSPASGHYEAWTYNPPSGYPTDGLESSHELWTWTATGFSHSFTSGENPPISDYAPSVWTATGALSDPYAAADLQADLTTLLDQWNLADDVTYPWRTDEQATIAPLVTYNEPPYAINPDSLIAAFADPTFVDPNTGFYDGTLRGAPLDQGYGPHFDWLHETWRQCHGADGTKIPYRYAYGAWSTGHNPAGSDNSLGDSTDYLVPPTATQWTWNYGAAPLPGNVPAWAWLIFDQTSGVLMGQKWAEIKVPRPSINFARPCGQDRFAIDPASARCATKTGSYTPPQVQIDSATSIATGDYCMAISVAGIAQGLYQVTKLADTLYELTTLVAAVATWADPAYPATVGNLLGKLRWPGAPGLCGQVAVAGAIQSGASVLITLASSPNPNPTLNLLPGDLLDFTGVPGLGAGMAVSSVPSTSSVLVPGTLTGAYSGGGYVSSHGAAAYQWNDDQPKGDFYTIAWAFSNRDYQERNRVSLQAESCAGCPDAVPADATPIRAGQAAHGMPQAVSSISVTEACLQFAVCCPQVICLSPNGETWVNGYTYAFPALASDCRYGAQWQAAVVQTIDDPFWLPPHAPCVSGAGILPAPSPCAWEEDDGTCQADTCASGSGASYYPRRPYVEARASLPTGAPALPAGCEINILAISDLNSATPPPGQVVPPPVALGYIDQDDGADPLQPVPAIMPWGIYLRELSCVCAHGRFAAQYELDNVQC